MAATLRFLTGPQANRTFQVTRNSEVVVGRDPSCAIVLDGALISRRHLSFSLHGGTLRLHTLSATNPVYVNSESVRDRTLGCDDIIVVGGISMQVMELDSDSRPRLPIPELERLPTLNNSGQYHALMQCVLSIQALLAEDGPNLVERCIGMVFFAIPATRLAVFHVGSDGAVTQGYTAFAGQRGEARLSHGFARKVLQAGRAILLEDIGDGQIQEFGQTLRDQDVRCAVGVPVFLDRQPVAVLIGDNLSRPGALDEDHARILGFAAFALSFAFQRDRLRAAEEERKRTESQMSAARLVQERICNKTLDCDVGGVRWAVAYQPALELGGDFYDLHIDGDSITWVHADVSGKGVPAALVVSMLRAFCKPLLQRPHTPAGIMHELDRLLQDEIPQSMFVTATVAQARGREITWCGVGHPPALLLPYHGSPQFFESTPAAVGMASCPLSGTPLTMHQHRLLPGERFCLVTDGVTEAMDTHGSQFGDTRLATTLQAGSGPPSTQVAALIADVINFGGQQQDDITVILGQG